MPSIQGGGVHQGPAKIVYLDQMQWIYLARAAHGLPSGDPYRPVLQSIRRALQSNRIVLPLGGMHYVETSNTGDAGRRQRLAETMAELSCFRTLVDTEVQRDNELRAALRRAFGESVQVSTLEVFGWGSGHAFQSDGKVDLSPFRALLPDAWSSHEQYKLSSSFSESDRQAAKVHWNRYAKQHVSITQSVDNLFKKNKPTHEDKAEYLRIEEMAALLDVALPILIESRVSQAAVDKVTLEWVSGLLDELPLTYVFHHLLRGLYDNSEIPRKDSTFADIAAIGQAVVCCDIVVTEKLWGDLAKRAGLDQRFNVVMLSNLGQLVPLLDA